MSYFVGILRGIGDIFLPYCPQILFLLEVSFMGIFEPHKSPVQKGKFSYIYIYIYIWEGINWTKAVDKTI